jgi:carbonic anhydrase
MCELNVIDQVINAAETTVVQAAWERNQPLSIHGWVYGLQDGLVRHLNISISNAGELAAALKTNWGKNKASLQNP